MGWIFPMKGYPAFLLCITQFGLLFSSEDSKTKASFVVSVTLFGDLRISSVIRQVTFEAIELYKQLLAKAV